MYTAKILLGVLALAALAQAVSLVVVFVQGRSILKGLEETGGRLGEGLKPALDNLTRTTASLAEATAIASAQLRRADDVISGLADKVEEARDLVDEVLVPSAVKGVALAAVVSMARATFARLRGGR